MPIDEKTGFLTIIMMMMMMMTVIKSARFQIDVYVDHAAPTRDDLDVVCLLEQECFEVFAEGR